ncbi:hypothetical protein BS47DRAFT_1382244, partial [Hydnum rufescens UP504]
FPPFPLDVITSNNPLHLRIGHYSAIIPIHVTCIAVYHSNFLNHIRHPVHIY